MLAAVTSPDPSTVATVASPLDHAIGAPAITLPFWSRTSELSCTVAPNAVSRAVAGLTVTVVGRGGSGGGGSVAPSPQGKRHDQRQDGRAHKPCGRIWAFIIVSRPLHPGFRG